MKWNFLIIKSWSTASTRLVDTQTVAVSCGYNTYFAVSACDGLCHLAKTMNRVETPFGFQSIMWTFVGHTVGRCLIFPALPGVARVTWLDWASHRHCKSIVNTIGFLHFLPTGQHGLCFGFCFSGPLPLRSIIVVPPFGGQLREFPSSKMGHIRYNEAWRFK